MATKDEVIATAQKWHDRLGHDYIVYMTPTGWQYCRYDLYFETKHNDYASLRGLVVVGNRSLPVR